MSDSRLSGLTELSTERQLTEELSFRDVITDFATRSRKTRRVPM